jgi:hypothetical protein
VAVGAALVAAVVGAATVGAAVGTTTAAGAQAPASMAMSARPTNITYGRRGLRNILLSSSPLDCRFWIEPVLIITCFAGSINRLYSK